MIQNDESLSRRTSPNSYDRANASFYKNVKKYKKIQEVYHLYT